MIKFKDIRIGQTIIDNNGTMGTVVKIEDIHNVIVDYNVGIGKEIDGDEYGVLCFDPKCEFYEENAKFL